MRDVEIIFKIIFCAVPAFSLVEPVIASAPVSGAMATSASLHNELFSLEDMATVVQFFSFAKDIAPKT